MGNTIIKFLTGRDIDRIRDIDARADSIIISLVKGEIGKDEAKRKLENLQNDLELT